MIGGSLGAQTVNAVLREALPALTKRFDVLHVCGKGNLDASLENTPGYKQFEYLSDELPDAFACADIMPLPRGQQFALRADGAVQARAADSPTTAGAAIRCSTPIRSRRAVWRTSCRRAS